MIDKKMQDAINDQVNAELFSAYLYYAMAYYFEDKNLTGFAKWMRVQALEEATHVHKFFAYVNERGGHAVVTQLDAPKTDFGSFQKMFKELLEHEIFVSQSINDLVHITLEEKDYATHNFLQWYVAEQIEEEALARTILDKINLIGNDKGGLYLFDRDVQQIAVESAAGEPGA